MTAIRRDALVAAVVHAREVPARRREAFGAQIRERLDSGALVLETCHRLEAYAIVADDRVASALGTLVPTGGRLLRGESAVRHAIRVAVGRDSVVVGEDQVHHQIRSMVDAARRGGQLDPVLERLFSHAMRAGRRSRSWFQGIAHRSLADVAIEAIERSKGTLRGRAILVVGAGSMGRLAARAAIGAGASVDIANRSPERARDLAMQTGARVVRFDPGIRAADYAGVVIAIGGPWEVGPRTLEALDRGATVVIDLSVPSAVSDRMAGRLADRLISADDLVAAAEGQAPVSGSLLTRLDGLVDTVADAFLAWLDRGDGRDAARALLAHADREREEELAALWRRVPDLQPATRDAIEGMTRHLAARLLREPLERLGRDTDGHHDRAVRDLFAL